MAENPGYADNGNNPSLFALSNDGLRSKVTLWADPSTHALVTSGGGGGGGSATVVGIGPVGQNQVAYDWIGYTATSATVDTFVYKIGGSGGTTTATVTVTYTDSTHATLVSVART